MSVPVTPSQTVGPFFSLGLVRTDGPFVVPEGTAGAFWIRGRIFDGVGDPVSDALVETWQCDADGRFAHPDDPRGPVAWPGFRGFARSATDVEGRFALLTVKPGRVPAGSDGEGPLQAPHLDVSVLARGLLDRVVTRIYFDDEAEANESDPVLGALVDPTRRQRLLAVSDGFGYRFDIHLQGEHESVFFAI